MVQQSDFRLNGMFQLIPKTGYGVEVGVYKGDLSQCILSNWDGTLYMVDTWRPMDDYYDKSMSETLFFNLNETIDKTKEYQDRGLILRMTSEQASNLFADNSLDFVYIDANHSYEYVMEDLRLWYPKLKKGGYLMGDDYLGYDKDWWYKNDSWVDSSGKDKRIKKEGKLIGHFGVNSAVNEFVVKMGVELHPTIEKKNGEVYINSLGGITNSKERNIWWGEWYFKKQEWTESKEPGGFVQWRKELQNSHFQVNKSV